MVTRVRRKKITAVDIRAALMATYSPPSHRVFFEVSNDTGTRSKRWIDALAVGIWPSTGYEIIGIEIKVSKSDWRSELANPRKSQELMRFCSRWFLACPEGLIDPNELPRTWGMLTLRSDGKLRQKVAAPLLEPEPITPGFMMAILRQSNGVDEALVDKLVEERMKPHLEAAEQRIERAVRNRVAENTTRAEKALRVEEHIKQITGHSIYGYAFDVDALAAAYLFFKETGLHRTRSYGLENLVGAADSLEKVAGTLRSIYSDPRFAQVRDHLTEGKSKIAP